MIKSIAKVFYGVFACLLLSGLLFAIPFYSEMYFDLDLDFFPDRGMLMKIHGAASMVILLILGCVWQGHSSKKLRSAKNRITGITMLLLFFCLTVTGYVLYYSGHEVIRAVSSLTHSFGGVIVLVFIVIHSLYSEKKRVI